MLIAVAPTAYFLGWLSASYNTHRQIVADPFPAPSERPVRAGGAAAQARRVLLLGSPDASRKPTTLASVRGQDSTTVTLIHVPSDRQRVWALSMLPSMVVAVPGHGRMPIGSTVRVGGVALAVKAIESLLNTRVDHVAVVPAAGFGELASALGGVTVDNPGAFHSRAYDFPVGKVTLTGARATAYLSATADLPGGDAERVQDQQQFVRALAHAMWRPTPSSIRRRWVTR
ncbi:LCP family protein [Amnibacterium sp. CER49]|uniref:LCP family protein n=1 Tax=Amnibacterium sp. CER49 TaxID=3039161 RepID=UPI00244B6AE9|nr:LCP family protein [Amnibacterium sp. CER49]MDH2442991.1 LCP family protein [Amnibacterium sp. CER49]